MNPIPETCPCCGSKKYDPQPLPQSYVMWECGTSVEHPSGDNLAQTVECERRLAVEMHLVARAAGYELIR